MLVEPLRAVRACLAPKARYLLPSESTSLPLDPVPEHGTKLHKVADRSPHEWAPSCSLTFDRPTTLRIERFASFTAELSL